MKYQFGRGVKKAVVAGILFAIPFFITNFPELTNLTIGAVLTLIANFIKVKYL